MRFPRGYVGTDHQTIGSDILAVLHALERITGGGQRLMAQLLGDVATDFAKLDPSGWYPIARFLTLLEAIDHKLGRYGLMRVGRTVFEQSHQERVKALAHTARDVVYAIDGMYRHANRGRDIGGWNVVGFEPGRAELEKTTPHHCAMEEGLLAQALHSVGVPALVSQRACFRTGAQSCLFVVESTVTDARWG